ADNAGIKATLRASEILEKEGVQVRVARLPEGDDPDSILKRGEIAQFQTIIDTAAGRVEYQLERITSGHDSKDDAGRALMLRQIVEILASIPSRAERDVYVNKVWRFHPMSAHGPSVASEQLHRDAEARAGETRGRPGGHPAPRPEEPRSGYFRADDSRFRERKWNGEFRPERTFDRRSGRQRYPVGPPLPPLKLADGLSGEQRAERELLRALAEPEWCAVVLKHIRPEDLLSVPAKRFAEFMALNQGAVTPGE